MMFTIVTIISLVIIVKIYTKLTTGWDRSHTCLLGKTAVITGANTGIGFYTALNLAMRGARVILACRNRRKAENARKKIIEITGNPNVVVKLFNAASFDSVREFAKDFNETEERLDILVNNAGMATKERLKTKDGCNLIMQVNYYSIFLLTHLLLDKLKASAPSRIVNVSSILHKIANIHLKDLDRYPTRRPFSYLVAYGNSKLGNICFTVELARRLKGTGVTVNALHPGLILTNICDEAGIIQRLLLKIFGSMCFKTSLEGAQTSIYLSVSPEVQNISGEYFVDCRKETLRKKITRDDFLKKVWHNTERIIQMYPEEKIF